MTTVQTVWYYKAAIFKCAFDALIAGAAVWMAAVANQKWSDLDSTAKAVIVVLTIVAIAKVWESFLSTTMADLKAAKPAADTQQEVTDYNKAKIAAVKRGSL